MIQYVKMRFKHHARQYHKFHIYIKVKQTALNLNQFNEKACIYW